MADRIELMRYSDYEDWTDERLTSAFNKLSEENQKDIKIFRGWKSVENIREMMSQGFEKYIDLHHLHITDGCSESCEPFLDDDTKPIKIVDSYE